MEVLSEMRLYIRQIEVSLPIQTPTWLDGCVDVVGASDGLALGETEGASDGVADGLRLGEVEGLLDGLMLGESDGEEEGFREGA